MAEGSRLRTVSWILLAIVGGLSLLFSLASAYVAYGGARDEFGRNGPTVADVAEWNPQVAKAISGRRGTAAAYAAGYSLLFLVIVLLPYRQGQLWSWWALLGASVLTSGMMLLRVPLLDHRLGAGTAAVQLALVIVALALGFKRSA